jgi:hypothetical protein
VVLSGGGGSEAYVTPKIETRFGTLRTYYLKSNGEKVFVNNNSGTIDYQLGKIIINSLRAFSVEINRFYDTNILTVNAPIDNEIINPLRNRIIDIDTDDPLSIQIQVIADQ